MADIVTQDNKDKKLSTDEDFFNSLKLQGDSSEEELKQQDDSFYKRLVVEPAVTKSEAPIETDNDIRASLLAGGFSNAEVDEYLGVTPESANSNTNKLVRALGGSADYIAKTLPQTVGSVITGSASWFLSKGAGAIVGLREGMDNGGDYELGMKEGERIEQLIAEKLTLVPTDPEAKKIVDSLSHVIEWFTGPAREVGKIAEDITAENPILEAVGADKLTPWVKYVSEFGTELITFKLLHVGGKKVGAKIEAGIEKAEGKMKPKKEAEVTSEEIGDFIVDQVLKDKSPEEALTDYDNIYPELAKKKAKESAEAFREGEIVEFKDLEHKKQIEKITELTKETGKSAEVSAKIFDSSESRIQELEVLIDDIKKSVSPEDLAIIQQKKGKIQTGKDIIGDQFQGSEIITDPFLAINEKVAQLLELKKVAEKATGQNLGKFYNDAINDVLKESPKEVKIEVQSVLKKEAMGKEVLDEVVRLEAEKAKVDAEIEARSTERADKTRTKIINEIERKRLEESIEEGRSHAEFLQKEIAKTEESAELERQLKNTLEETEAKSTRLREETLKAIEVERLRLDIEFGKSYADFLGEEISRIENEITLGKEPESRFIKTETYIQAKNRFAKKSKELRSGIDPEMAKDLITIGAYHIETGFRNFKKWSELMVKQNGEKIRPHLNDLWEKSNEFFKENLINKAGEEIAGEKRQRKFIDTVKESPTTEEGLREAAANVKPQEYNVQPNKESLSKANDRIAKSAEDAEKYVKSDATLSAEKGATFISLIEKNQSEGNFEKAVDLTEAYDLQLREAGRFVQAASIWNKLTPEGFLKWAQKEINKVNEKRGFTDRFFNSKKAELTKEDKAFITEEMGRINKMKDGPEKTKATLDVIDFVATKAPPTISEMIDAYRYQNMLSGWQTQERNIGENIFNTVMTRPYDLAVEGAIDYVQSTLQGKSREAYAKDIAVYYRGAINSIPNALDAFKAVIKMDVESFGKPDIGVDFKSEIGKARAKQLPKSLTVVSRFMEASDRFNSTLISSGEYAVLRKKGVSHEKALAESKALGQRYLYRNKFDVNKNDLSYMSKVIVDLDKLLVESRHLPVIGKPMSWFIPFIRTPMNKGIAMIEHSPLGYARSLNSFNKQTASHAIGGSVITAIGAMYALQNKTTWVAPSDPELKKLFYASGKRPFSVLMGDRWVPVWYLGPFAMAFALPAATKYYHEDQKLALSKNSFEKMIDIANGSARFIGSQSSTQSIGAFFNLLAGDVDYTTPHQLGFMTEQILPLSGLVRTTNKVLDPVYRKPDGYFESIMKDLPVLSKDIEAHTTPLGEQAERDVFNAFIPYETGKTDNLYDALYQDTLEIKQFEAKERKEAKKLEKELK